MRDGWLSLLLKLALSATSLYVAYWVYWEFRTGRPRRELIKQHGCKPAKRLRNLDPLFGLDRFFQFLRWHKQHVLLEQQQLLFSLNNARTFIVAFLNAQVVLTVEVENVKTILSLAFDSWGIGNSRKIMVPLLGEGIFSSDGSSWRHSRDMLRPIFVRSQLNDLSLLELHVPDFIRAIPRDGSTVNLQTLFARLALDIASELLFGESTNDLSVSGRGEHAEFIGAYDRCLSVLGGNTSWGILGQFLPNRSYKRDCQLIHSQSHPCI